MDGPVPLCQRQVKLLARSRLHRQGGRKLDLDQRQAAELFGGGVNAFSRYESGKTKLPLAVGQAVLSCWIVTPAC